jgi:hypothetical protein
MSNGKTDLFVFLGAAFATLVGLTVLHVWYASYIDVAYHKHLADNGPYESVVSARQDDRKALEAGKIPIERAMAQLGQRGRATFGSIAPQPSADLSALSGWIYHPGFKPVVAHPVRTAAAPAAAPEPAPAAAAAPPAAAPTTATAAPSNH